MERATLVIVGDGALARDIQYVASRLGYPARTLSALGDGEVSASDDHVVVTVTTDDADSVRLHDWERRGIVVRPRASTLAAVSNRVAMRRLVSATGVPVAPWREVTTESELRLAVVTWPAMVMKSARSGLRRSGIEFPDNADDALRIGTEALRRGEVMLVEQRLALDLELSVAVVRRPNGQVAVYPPMRTVQLFGRCREVITPAGIDHAMEREAMAIARRVADRLEVVGMLTVELFVSGRGLTVNEVLARPRHAASHSWYAFTTSHVENHLRAVLDLPLGSVEASSDSVVMVNILGDAAGHDPRLYLAEAMALHDAVSIELFDEAPRFDRLLGHVVARAGDEAEARRRAWSAVVSLRGDLTPVRPVVGGDQPRGMKTTAPATRRRS